MDVLDVPRLRFQQRYETCNRGAMPERQTLKRARRARREGKSPSTQAGEFVREEIRHVRRGVHGARSTKQLIAIGLSKARRAGVKLPPPPRRRISKAVRRRAVRDYRAGQQHHHASRARSRASFRALRREGHGAASATALAYQARRSARGRSPAARSAAAKRAVRTRLAAA
jgi:hypothetical protein